MFSDAMLLRQPMSAEAQEMARLRRSGDRAHDAASRPAPATEDDGVAASARADRSLQRHGEPSPRERGRVTWSDVASEFVGHRDNWPFLGLALGIAGWLAATGPRASDLAWAAVGLLLFIPQEYFTHVHLLHLAMPRSRRLYTWLYRLHYGHHDHPRRHDLMYMPLWLTLPMMAANLLLMWALTAASTPAGADQPRAFAAAFGGALVGYLVFEWCHLLCHVPFVPRGRVWRQMRTQHLLHHFSDETRGYSVAPWSLPMDRLMRTRASDERTPAARSTSCRYLGLEDGHPWIAHARQRFAARSSGDLSGSRLWRRAASDAVSRGR